MSLGETKWNLVFFVSLSVRQSEILCFCESECETKWNFLRFFDSECETKWNFVSFCESECETK